MKKMAWMAGALLATATTLASAQMYYGRSYDAYGDRPDWRNNGDQECWNPRAGHFERVRPNEYQDDLDFRRCRLMGNGNGNGYESRGYEGRQVYSDRREECWNPRAGHYELARRGEYQGDLDYTRCRIAN